MKNATTQSIRLSYLDFELEIGLGENNVYPVAVVRSPAGETRTTMIFPFTDSVLKSHLDKLQTALLKSGRKRRAALSEEEQAVQEFGQELFKALFTGDVRSLYYASRQQADNQVKGLRVKLHVLAPEMAALPWEFLFDPSRGDYVSLSARTPIIRYLELPQPSSPLTVRPPLRILGMVASPSNLPELDIAQEKRQVEEALKHLQARGLVQLTWLPGQTWRDLQQAMQGGSPWHIFHFIGHAGFDRRDDEGFIVLVDEDKDGDSYRLPARKLARLLEGHAALRLVLLNACEGGQVGKRDIFTSTAATLIRQSIPAVLAMQYEITDQAALEFARSFYGAIADGLPIDTSVVSARKAISIAIPNSIEWGTPVLYMRSPDGFLFNIEGQKERLAQEKAEAERLAQQKTEEALAVWEKAQGEHLNRKKLKLEAEQERLAQEKAEAEQLAKQKAAAEALAHEQAERVAREKAAAEEQAKRQKQFKFWGLVFLAILGMITISLVCSFILIEGGFKGVFAQSTSTKVFKTPVFQPTSTHLPIQASRTPLPTLTPTLLTSSPTPTVINTDTPEPQSTPTATNLPVITLDPTQLRQIAKLPGEGQVYNIAWSPDGTHLAISNTDGIRIWEVATQSFQFLLSPTCFPCGLAWSSDGQRLAVGLGDVTIRVWDVPSKKVMFNLRGHEKWVSSVAWSSDGNFLASGSNDTNIYIWDMSTGKMVHTLTGHTGEVNSVAWSPDDKRLASGSSDDTVKVWDVASEQALFTLTRRTNGVFTVAWASDGIRLAASSNNGTLRIWDTTNGTELVKMTGHTGAVYSVAWLDNDRWLASGSSDLTVRVWDVSNGNLLKKLTGHKNYVRSVAWSPQALKLASGDLDGAIIIWGVP